jgi:serine/threonine-protein kinase
LALLDICKREQAAGRPVYATDIYSLGLTAIYLLTGKSPQELQSNQQTGEILWQNHAPNISPHLATILSQAIKPNAGDRFSTASKMLHALHISSRNSTSTLPTAVSAQPTQALPTPANPSPTNGQQKSASIALTAAVLMFSMGYSMVIVGRLDQRSPKVPVAKNPTPTPLPLVLTELPDRLKVPVAKNPTPTPLPLVLTELPDRLVASQHTPTPVLSNLPTPKISKYLDLKPSKFSEITKPADITLPPLTPRHSAVGSTNLPPLVLNTPRQTAKQPLTFPYNSKPIPSPKVSRRLELQQEIERLRAKYRDQYHETQQPIPITQSKPQIILSPSPTSINLHYSYPSSVEFPASPPEPPLIERLRESRDRLFYPNI